MKSSIINVDQSHCHLRNICRKIGLASKSQSYTLKTIQFAFRINDRFHINVCGFFNIKITERKQRTDNIKTFINRAFKCHWRNYFAFFPNVRMSFNVIVL